MVKVGVNRFGHIGCLDCMFAFNSGDMQHGLCAISDLITELNSMLSNVQCEYNHGTFHSSQGWEWETFVDRKATSIFRECDLGPRVQWHLDYHGEGRSPLKGGAGKVIISEDALCL